MLGHATLAETPLSALPAAGPAYAGPTLVGSPGTTTSPAAGTTLTLNTPASAVAGNLLIAMFCTNGTAVVTPPSGWTLLYDDGVGTAPRTFVYGYVLPGAPASTYSWTISSSSAYSGTMFAITGFNAAQWLDVAASFFDSNPTTTSNPIAYACTTVTAHTLGLYMINNNTTANTYTSPSGIWAESYDAGANRSHVTGYGQFIGPGAQGDVSVTSSGSARYRSIVLAIRPAGGGGSFSRTADDSAPASDAVARAVALPRSLAESAPASDAVARASSRSRSLAESAPASDAVARGLVLSRGVAESAPASDTVARASSRSRTAAESAPASDAVARAVALPRSLADSAPTSNDTVTPFASKGRTAADSAPASDAVTRTLGGQARTAADSAPASDAVARASSRSRSLADSAPASDAVTRASSRSRSLADSAPASDAVARAVALPRSLAESAPATDTASGVVSGGGPLSRGVAESAPASDTVARAVALPRSLAESALPANLLTAGQADGSSGWGFANHSASGYTPAIPITGPSSAWATGSGAGDGLRLTTSAPRTNTTAGQGHRARVTVRNDAAFPVTVTAYVEYFSPSYLTSRFFGSFSLSAGETRIYSGEVNGHPLAVSCHILVKSSGPTTATLVVDDASLEPADLASATVNLPRGIPDAAPASDTVARGLVLSRVTTETLTGLADVAARSSLRPRAVAESAPTSDALSHFLAIGGPKNRVEARGSSTSTGQRSSTGRSPETRQGTVTSGLDSAARGQTSRGGGYGPDHG